MKRFILAAVFAAIPGCDKNPQGHPAGMAGVGGPLEVDILTLAPSQLTLTRELPGRISAFRVAEVRARVNGIVQKRLFTEGGDVSEGQALYQIDPAPYQAELDRALAMQARAEANVESAKAKEQRFRLLSTNNAVSGQDRDDAAAALHMAEADVLAGKAAVQSARINLGYTEVRSPVTGRVGLSMVTEGAYVQASTATLMATVQQLDPVYVDVTQSSNDLLKLKKALVSGELSADTTGQTKVTLRLDDGSDYPYEGTLQFSDVTVSTTTSSVTVRATFPNPNGVVLPGMFVRARLVEGTKADALLVPQSVVSRNTKGEATVYVVGDGDKVELRVIGADRAVGNQWLIASGLKAGDRIVTNNLQKIRPGALVKVAAASLPSSTAVR